MSHNSNFVKLGLLASFKTISNNTQQLTIGRKNVQNL